MNSPATPLMSPQGGGSKRKKGGSCCSNTAVDEEAHMPVPSSGEQRGGAEQMGEWGTDLLTELI